MAETKRRGRPPKSATIQVKKEVEKKEVSQEDIIKQLMEQLAEQNAKMAEMQKQIEEKSVPQTVVVNNESSSAMRGRKIKVINLMHNPLNIATQPNGRGRVYSFRNYGDSRLIKFDDLADIVASYPYTMEHGLAYICDKEAVEELGLSDEYTKLFDKERMPISSECAL